MSLPVLNAAKCTGCGVCLRLCPAQCLERRGPLPWLPRPLDCVSCSVCEIVCPEGAIVLPRANPKPPSMVQKVENAEEIARITSVRKA